MSIKPDPVSVVIPRLKRAYVKHLQVHIIYPIKKTSADNIFWSITESVTCVNIIWSARKVNINRKEIYMDGHWFEQIISDFGHEQDCYLLKMYWYQVWVISFRYSELKKCRIIKGIMEWYVAKFMLLKLKFPQVNTTLICCVWYKCLQVWIIWFMKIVNWYHHWPQCIK